MSETATRNLRALARSKKAVSEHAQEHAPRFSAAVLDMKELLSNIKSGLLSQIRDSLLPKLMSGKIRVPVEVKA